MNDIKILNKTANEIEFEIEDEIGVSLEPHSVKVYRIKADD